MSFILSSPKVLFRNEWMKKLWGNRLTQSRLKNGRLNSGWFVVEFLSRATLAELRRWWLVAPSDSAGSCLWLAAEMLYLTCGVGGVFSVNCPGRRPWVVCISAVVIHGGWSVAALRVMI